MASPEVERPRASPSNPVLSPHGLSPGAGAPSSTHPSPGGNTSRKVVTFDQCLDPMKDEDRGASIQHAGSLLYNKARIGRHGNIVGGSNQRSHGSYKYRHSTQRSSVSSIQCSTDIENKDRNVVLDSEEKEENRLSLSMESAMLNPVCIQTKRFRNGGGIRKRSYSFSEGHFKPVSSVSSMKRWKHNHHKQQSKDLQTNSDDRVMAKISTSAGIPKKGPGSTNPKTKPAGGQNQSNKSSKFLLGGNIRDPLNLNSLSDERVAKAINAVTPQSSPLPTPKHRKAEYKIEVLIPPDISDPLNLMNADTCEGDYESQLLSPVLARRKKATDAQKLLSGVSGTNSSALAASAVGASLQGGKKPRLRKRTRSAKQSRDSRDTKPPDMNDAEIVGPTQTMHDLESDNKQAAPKQKVSEDKEMPDSVEDSNINEKNENDDVQENLNVGENEQVTKDSAGKTLADAKNEHDLPINTDGLNNPKPAYKFPKPTKRPLPFSWKKYRKANQQRKINGAEIVSPVVQTPPQIPFGGGSSNIGILRGPRQFYRGSKSTMNRRSSHGVKSASGSTIMPKQYPVSPTKNKIENGTKQSKLQRKTFEYGNYNRYYGYRNADHGKDPRLKYLHPEWFAGKDVLDIGCNVGHVTLAIARNLNPKSILGVDIDENLIRAAKQNVKHYTSCIMPTKTPQYGTGISTNQTPLNTPLYSGRCITPSRTPSYPGWDTIENINIQQPNVQVAADENSAQAKSSNKNDLFPICMPIIFGPIDPTNPSLIPGSVRESDHSTRDVQGVNTQGSISSSSFLSFPQNIRFACTNYVLESDELLDIIQPEYDTILCLSTTKWIHLNFGDEGIKRAFKRMYAQLRYGGKLILEAQGFNGYKKRKNLTQRIRQNFDNIGLRPENFYDYLLHEVSFTIGETIAIPTHASQGFQRPLQVFTKLPPMSSRSASSCQTTPYYAGSSSHAATPYYMPPSPLGMFPPRNPGRPCYAPVGELTPMYSNNWPEADAGYEPDTTVNPSSSGNTPTASGYSPSGFNPSTTPGYSPYSGSITPSQTPTGSGPPSTSNSPFGAHGSP